MDGYKIVEDLTAFNNWTQSYRYKVLKLEKDGNYFLFKQANDDFTKELLKNEVRWREFFKSVNAKNVTSTKILEAGEDYLLFEWIEADVLARPEPKSVAKLENQLDRYLDLIMAIRQAAKGYKPDGDESKAIKPESRYDSPLAYHERIKPLIGAGWTDSQTIKKVQALYNSYLPYAQGGYQHGDFTPWHIFVKGDQWIIFDAEHATSLRSGYTDLSHSYVRITCKGKNPKLAAKLLNKYLDKSAEDVNDFKNKIMSELVKKSAGSLIDAYNDRHTSDYRQEANDLLDKVLKDDLNVLLQTP